MKHLVGIAGILAGLLVLSLELYGLKVIQALEMACGRWRTNAWGYLQEPQCLAAVLITVAVLLCACCLAAFGGRDR